MATLSSVKGIKTEDVASLENKCEGCAFGKSTCQPRRTHEPAAKRPVEGVYSDVLGPMRSLSLGEAKYFVTILDEYSGFSTVQLLHRKSDTGSAVT